MMIKKFLLLFMLFLGVNTFGQDDNIYLFPDYVIYKGDTLCQFDKQGLKQGDWIDYKLNFNLMVPLPDSCLVQDNGDLSGDRYTTQHYSRYKTINDSDCDSIFANVIPKIVVDFLSFGNYINDNKTGKWQTYDKDGDIYKEVNYQDGSIFGDLFYYHKNGLIKINGTVSSDKMHIDAKFYSDQGQIYKRDSI
jgi:hypothetical protein